MATPSLYPWTAEPADLAIDPVRAREVRTRRLRELHTRTLPVLRLTGANFLIFAAVVHNVLILGAVDWVAILLLTAFIELYCFATWWALRRWYDPDASPDLALTFLVTDLVPMAAAVYVTAIGETRSEDRRLLLENKAKQTTKT